MEVVAKPPYWADCRANEVGNPEFRSFMWAKIRCFTSNMLVNNAVSIRLGSFVAGIAIATYNGTNRAVLDVWGPADIFEWRFTSWPTLIDPDELTLDERTLDWLPTLGGWCFPKMPGGGKYH